MEYMPVEEHAVYRGPEAVSQYTQRWLEAWDTFSLRGGGVESTPVESRGLAPYASGARARGAE